MKLDAKTIATLRLPPGKHDHVEWDDDLPGFGLRLRLGKDRVRRSWVVQYRPRGSRRTPKSTLGSVETVTPTQARDAARKILARVALGHDPQGERRAKQAQSARTFRSAVEAYLAAKQPGLRPESHRINKLYLLDGDYFRPLHSTSVNEITHPDIAARLSNIIRNHSAHTAAAARRAASAAFRWFMEEGWTTANPVIGTRKPPDPRPREHVLSNAEFEQVWNVCGDDDFGRIVRLLILLGSRRQEVGGMRWSELDLDAGSWTLPAERSKNHRPHTIALPAAALTIIESVPRTNRDHLFGDRAGDGFTSWSRFKHEIDQQLSGRVKPWRLHDLRRTVATGMADIGVEPHHIEAALNHYGGHRRGVAGVYNRSNYNAAVKTALTRWSEHILGLVEGRAPKVVPLIREAG
jgi:integrase